MRARHVRATPGIATSTGDRLQLSPVDADSARGIALIRSEATPGVGCSPAGGRLGTVALKERPIIFSGAMVRAILEGRKTQTRRIIRPQPEYTEDGWIRWRDGECAIDCFASSIVDDCPFGLVGDHLWVRETWYCDHYQVQRGLGGFKEVPQARELLYYRATDCDPSGQCYTGFAGETMNPPWNPAIHMPRWASRIALRISEVRAQRLQDITEADAIAEGAQKFDQLPQERPFQRDVWSMESPTARDQCLGSARMAFANFICKLHHGERWNLLPTDIWHENPWVWALSFEKAT